MGRSNIKRSQFLVSTRMVSLTSTISTPTPTSTPASVSRHQGKREKRINKRAHPFLSLGRNGTNNFFVARVILLISVATGSFRWFDSNSYSNQKLVVDAFTSASNPARRTVPPAVASSVSLLPLRSQKTPGEYTGGDSDDSSQRSFRNHLSSSGPPNNKFFALRHGQSLANVAGIIASDPGVACHRYGLSEAGTKQAETAGRELVVAFREERRKAGGARLGGIALVTSDLLRARETAQIVANAVLAHNEEHPGSAAIPLWYRDNDIDNNDDNNDAESISSTTGEARVTIDRRLRERGFGDWDGGSDSAYGTVWEEDAADPCHTSGNVESVWSVADRATSCVAGWERGMASQNRGEGEQHRVFWVVCVAHGDVLQILQAACCGGRDPSRHRSVEHLETATLRPLEPS